MDAKTSTPNHILSFLAVVNQLHRMASNTPAGTFPPGMTVSQLAAIAFLYFRSHQDTFQKDIEINFKLRRSTVSSLLNTLERKGFLHRVSVPQDARLKKLVLTKEAQQIGTCIHETFSDLDKRMFRGIPQKDLDTLDSVLSQVQKNLSQIETCS